MSTREFLKRRDEIFFRVTPNQLYELFSEYEGEKTNAAITSSGHHIGGPRIVVHDVEAKEEYEQPYLILDLRDAQSFEEYRVRQSRSYPSHNLKQDKYTSEMLQFKNREGKLIILYGNGERSSIAAATQLVERGFENIYVLEGGILAFSTLFPDYLEGVPPENPPPKTAATTRGGVSRGGVTSRGWH